MTEQRVRRTLTFPVGRCGYPKLNPSNPPMQGLEPNERKRWSINGYYSPGTDATKRLQAEITAAAEEFENFHGYEPAKCPKLKRVTEWANKTKTKKSDPSLIGLLSIDVGKNAEKQDGSGMHPPPALVGPDREPIPHGDIYPGCYVRIIAVLDEYKAKNKAGAVIAHGLSLNLKVVQFIRDGERMGGDTTDYTKYLDEEYEVDGETYNTDTISDDDI